MGNCNFILDRVKGKMKPYFSQRYRCFRATKKKSAGFGP